MIADPGPFLPHRRKVLAGAASVAALASLRAMAQDQAAQPSPMADGAPFSRERLLNYARDLAKRPYVAPNAAMPDGLRDLNYDSYASIRNRRERAVWIENPRGFLIEPLHRGFIYQAPVQIAVIENGAARRLVYSPARYDFGKVPVPPASIGDIGFSGFRVISTARDQGGREIALFQGASFMRAIARGQNFGTIARALSIKTADPRGEEFPFFRAFWIEEPTRDDMLVVHGLLDSESASGVFIFTLRVSDMTLVDTEGAIFPRVALESFGIAGMQSTYLYGYADRRNAEDYRPQVLEANGLSIAAGNGEYIWRPLANPRQLQISSFATDVPKGFGLVMRDRDFNDYQDVDARFEMRPTLWVEPIGDWGPGAVQLVEIPSDNEIHDNIIVQWRPKTPLAAGSEFLFAYRQHWTWSPPDKPALAIVTGTRIARNVQRRRRFLVDITGEKLTGIPLADLSVALWSSNNGAQNARIVPIGEGRPLRVIFDLDMGNESLIELRMALMNANTQISETWLYRWTA